jgi:hypothetical protein
MKFDMAYEMNDEQLEAVYGGGGAPLGLGLGGGSLGVGAAQSAASSQRIHSFSVVCDVNIFSLNLDLIPIINIATCTTQVCANKD